MSTFPRILKNLGAILTGRALSILQQLVLPPIFIHLYGLAGFGEWIVLSGDLKVCGLPLVQTLRMRWPRTRASTPLATVSTSGSSGTLLRISEAIHCARSSRPACSLGPERPFGDLRPR